MIGAGAKLRLGRLVALGTAPLVLVVVLGALGAAGISVGSASCATGETAPGELGALPAQAREFASLYTAAAKRYRLGTRGPAILASIHRTESGFGANMGPSSAGAVGQMQFLPSTWATYGVDANGDGRRDPYEPADAIFGAARYLRASGAPGDWRRAIFAYNHAGWYVEEIFAGAGEFGDLGDVAVGGTVVCEPEFAGGPAELGRAIRVYEPARDLRVPARYVAPGFAPVVVDARIWPDVRWVLETYGLLLTAGKETGHRSHGDGSAIDAVPAREAGSVASWGQSAERLARDLGWRPACAASGVRPACDLVPAIEFVGYNGYDRAHGDRAHSSSPHIHVSWVSATHGAPQLTTPEWMLVFPLPGAGTTATAFVPQSEGAVALVVGDSLTVGSAPILRQRLGDQVAIDARSGRTSAAGAAVLAERLRPGHRIVVYDLGTNDDPSRPNEFGASLERARRIAAGRCLVVATVSRADAAPLNRVIERFAAHTAGVELVDWHAISHRGGLLSADGVHPSAVGYRRRANALIAAMVAC